MTFFVHIGSDYPISPQTFANFTNVKVQRYVFKGTLGVNLAKIFVSFCHFHSGKLQIPLHGKKRSILGARKGRLSEVGMSGFTFELHTVPQKNEVNKYELLALSRTIVTFKIS